MHQVVPDEWPQHTVFLEMIVLSYWGGRDGSVCKDASNHN